MKEELGIEGARWTELGLFYLETSMFKSPTYLFVVQNLSFTTTNPDDTEDIKPVKLTLEAAKEKVLQNEFTHSPSCLLLLKTYLQKDKFIRS